MAKVTNKTLAKLIANRISEALNSSGLTLLGYSILSNVQLSYLKSIHSASKPVAVETAYKLAISVGIELHDYLNFEKPLPEDLIEHPKLTGFYKQYKGKRKGYFVEEGKNEKRASQTRKYEREKIKYIINQTDYFAKPRIIANMVEDFANEYKLILKSNRIYQLLTPYVGEQLVKIETTKKTKNGNVSKKKVFKYLGKK
ncbi:hypothetical protein [Sinomicrobium oceani]|uniref:hypothetical protein n=1 Tax=Sinomicrobium oceani TaxID=1150368 RepID=UPI00227D6026|nr:hypothetical protein [Sinomicrobium oceani]